MVVFFREDPCVLTETGGSVTSPVVHSVCRFVTDVGGEPCLSVCGSKGKSLLISKKYHPMNMTTNGGHLAHPGHEEDLQGVSEVPGLEEEARPGLQALDLPGTEPAALRQPPGPEPPEGRLPGEHRREWPERGQDAQQRGRGDLRDSNVLFVFCGSTATCSVLPPLLQINKDTK